VTNATLPTVSAIPADLQAIPRWLHWQSRVVNGRQTKVPVDPINRAPIDATNPASFTTFDDAVASCPIDCGLGLALTGDGLVGVDVDGCIDDLGALDPDVAAIVFGFGSYAEVSPSGRGIRVFVRGELPPRGRRRGMFEIYDRGRFLTVTGNHLTGTPRRVVENQPAIDRFHAAQIALPDSPLTAAPVPSIPLTMDDTELLARARAARNGAKFERLWSGDISEYDGDDSRADEALCSLLAFWTQDTDQLDRLFRQSGLYREKWERRADYRNRTIDKALNRSVFYTAVAAPSSPEIRVVAANRQDAASAADPCESVRDELAALRAENARLRREDDELRQRSADRDRLSILLSRTLLTLRSKNLRPGEKVVGLVTLLDAAARQDTADADGWLDAPLARLGAAGCSSDTAGKHLTTIASTGAVEVRTVSERDPVTHEVRKRRQIRLPVPAGEASPPELAARIAQLADATPERHPDDKGWGGKRVCPDCGDAGTVTMTTIACAGCGRILHQTRSEHAPDPDPHPPLPHLAGTTPYCGSSPMPQLAASGIATRRVSAAAHLAAQSLVALEPPWLADAPPPWDPQPALFTVPDPPRIPHHFATDGGD
jgi:putative DNA primase/helicase